MADGSIESNSEPETSQFRSESIHMADDRQSEVTIDVGSTVDSQGPGNDLSEDRNDEFRMDTGSTRQVSIKGSSSRNLPQGTQGSNTTDDFWLFWGLRKYLVLLGVLAVGVTYNAGLTPPEGFWTLNRDGHHAGDPILHDGYPERYAIFFYCNATAFAASLVLIILLLSKRVTKEVIWLRSMQLTMIIDLFSLLGAYAAGSCRAVKTSIYIWILVFAVFIYIGIHILVFTKAIPETLTNKLQTVLHGILTRWGVRDRQVITHIEKDVEEARKFILMLVTFAATITYQAGLNPPGGFWAENEHGSSIHLALPPYKHHPATSVLRSNYLHRYNIFIIFNSTSFVASLVIIILLLSPELSGRGIRTKAVIVCVIADLVCLVFAYSAGCSRDIATSFYVVFIVIIVLASFALLATIFVCRPVANLLKKVKSSSLWCMGQLGRVLSLNSISRNADQENSHASNHQSSVKLKDAGAEDNTPEPQDQRADNQQAPSFEDGEPLEEHAPAGNQHISDIQEAASKSQHSLENNQQSTNVKDVVSNSNLECQSTYEPHFANMEDVSSSQTISLTYQHLENTEDVVPNVEDVSKVVVVKSSTEHEYPSHEPRDQPADNQQVSGMRQQSSNDYPKMSILPVEQNMSGNHSSNGDTSHDIVDEELSAPMEVSGNVNSAEQNILVEDNNRQSQTEIGGTNTNLAHFENGHTDSSQGVPTKNAEDIQTEKHLKKTRTNLLLLAILAVSLAYQSGLNPPGGFWSRSEDQHSAADRTLEDIHHDRFITFFYLNAAAFVASIIIIMMILNKMMSKMVTKRRVLPGMMIVVLLSLTGAFSTGNCRDAKKQNFILVSVWVVLAYVLLHVLIAIHVIPGDWREQVAQKLNCLPVYRCWPVPSQSGHHNLGDENDLEQRRSLLLTLAILAVTVTYQAGMNPPGGVWSDDKDVTGTPGNPVLQDTHPKRYDVFYYSNSVSFVSSVVVTILLVNKESCKHGIESYALRVCLVVGLLGLLIAYVAGSCRNTKQAICVSIIAMAVLVSLLIQVLLSWTLVKPLAEFIGEFLQSLLPHENVRQAIITSQTPEVPDCEKIERKRYKYLMLLAILAASSAYQAGLSPPGGFWSDDEGHVPGNPVLHYINHLRYKIFFSFNSFGFMASIVMIMLLLSKSVRKKAVPLDVLHLIMILDLLALMTTFAAGSSRHLKTSVYVYALVPGCVVYLVLLVLMLSAIAKYLKLGARSGLSTWRRASGTNMAAVPKPGLQV